MTAAAEPYAPVRREPVSGDGSAACYAEREVFFDGRFLPTRLYRRERLVPGNLIHAPAMITEYTAATVLPPGSSAEVDGFENLILHLAEEESR
jgi:N-methylhydantoinase A